MDLVERYKKLKGELKEYFPKTEFPLLKQLDEYVEATADEMGDDLTNAELDILIDFVIWCGADQD